MTEPPYGSEETYTTKTEREVAFKLIAAHALVDDKFYQALRSNPREAVAMLHFQLDDDDYAYLEGKTITDEKTGDEKPGIEWKPIDDHIGEIRNALNAPTVVRSLW